MEALKVMPDLLTLNITLHTRSAIEIMASLLKVTLLENALIKLIKETLGLKLKVNFMTKCYHKMETIMNCMQNKST